MSECVVLNRRKLLLLGGPWILARRLTMFGQESSEYTAKAVDTNRILSATFDVASIRLNKTTSGYAFLGFTPDGFSAKRSLLQSIIVFAFALQDPTLMRSRGKQIPGLPKWALTDRYDIAAKMSDSDVAAINKLNSEQQLAQRRQMIQALLADRFKLKIHRETHQVPCYALIEVKNGPKNLNRVADDAEISWT